MRCTTTVILLATALGLAGCSSTLGEPGPAQKLADLDGRAHPTSQYQTALDTWASRCEETRETLAGYVYATVEDLRKNGVREETEYSALVHLKDATPSEVTMKCADIAAGYLALRESGTS